MVTKSSYELLDDLKVTLQNGTLDDLYALATFLRSLEILFSRQESTYLEREEVATKVLNDVVEGKP